MKSKALIVIIAIGILGILAVSTHSKKAVPQAAAPSSNTSSLSQPTQKKAPPTVTSLKDGTFTGSSSDTPYGAVQVAAVINGGKITDIKFLQMPFDMGHSREVTAFAEPQLKAEAISGQTAKVDFVSGATDTSIGFQDSLQAALDQAAQA
jgi:uncharacterized protein with FMN-binding domain